MIITRAVLAAAAAVALMVGCGDDSSNSNASKFAKCGTGTTGAENTKCSSCVQSKCGDVQEKCFGKNYSGGLCADYISCASKAADPCKATNCTPAGECLSCIMSDLPNCVPQKCASDCTGGTNTGTGGDTGSGGGSGTGAGTGSGAVTGTG